MRPARLLAVLALAGAGCQGARGAPVGFDLARARLVDLTWAFDKSTLYWPNAPSTFELRRLHHGKTPAGFFYSANALCTPEHGGTHLDAPIHFAQHGDSAERVSLRRLIGPAVVIDVRAQAARDRDYRASAEDVRRWEAAHGAVPEGAIVLLHTGWGARWPDRKRYLGDDRSGVTTDLHFPSYGRDAAEHLVRARRVGALGVDTASIDHGPSRDFIVHQVAMAANVPGLENVAHLEQLPPRGAWVVALPMKIAGGSGGPTRIVALLPPER
jgi:kynurenine formamidase